MKIPVYGCHTLRFRLPYYMFHGKKFLNMSEVKEIFKQEFPHHIICCSSGAVYPDNILFLFQLNDHIDIDFYCNQERICDIPTFPI